MPGAVLGIPDDLSHGPLDDGRARIDYMRACFRGYDDWYLDVTDACAPWRALIAVRIVGTAMGRCGEHNPMSDLFFSSRLQFLIDAGRVEADGPRHRLREYAVRLVQTCMVG
jgi:hypothetical protein